MNTYKILNYALITLVGMIVATFAAYYVLNEFVYPLKSDDVGTVEKLEEVPATETTEVQEAVPVGSATTAQKVVTFTGTLEAVNTGCFADGECFVTVDNKHVTAIMGWSRETVGTIIGVEGFGDLEQYLGKQVEVSAQEVETGKYTLYGSEAYYIKVLE
jgi:hypothetical protein